MKTMAELIERIGARREITETGCWLFMGHHNDKGYPRIYVSREYPTVGLARVALAFAEGLSLDDGWQTRHTCTTTGCWNPEHLQSGTVYQNLSDKWGQIVADRKTEVDAMLREGLTVTEIARRTGLSRTSLYQYRNGRMALKPGVI